MRVYEKINEIRKSKGITWKYLNEQIPGAYSSRMTELKNGKTTLSKNQLEIVADILGTTTDYLLGNTDDPAPAGQKEKPAPVTEGGLSETKYGQLTPENRELVDSLIEKLLKSQSGD